MIKYFFTILCCLFFSACALPEDITYNYDPNAPTIGLTVTPEVMELTPDKANGLYNFVLSFSTDELVLKGIGTPVIDDPNVFSVNAPTVEECRYSAANYGQCLISVHYKAASGKNNSKGYIELEFMYTNDMNPEGNKKHILHFTEIAPSKN